MPKKLQEVKCIAAFSTHIVSLREKNIASFLAMTEKKDDR